MKAKPGPKLLVDRPVRWEMSLPLSLATEVELLMKDPFTGKTAKGKRSEVVQQLLRQWVKEQNP